MHTYIYTYIHQPNPKTPPPPPRHHQTKQDGAVLVNGQNVRDVTLPSLRSSLGVVPQDTLLFNDTIYYNIAYGNLQATREEVEAAAMCVPSCVMGVCVCLYNVYLRADGLSDWTDEGSSVSRRLFLSPIQPPNPPPHPQKPTNQLTGRRASTSPSSACPSSTTRASGNAASNSRAGSGSGMMRRRAC
jgi:hypothetical protein